MTILEHEQLEKIAGGSWDFGMLTPEERGEYDSLEDARIEAENTGDWNMANSYERRINAFIARMNARYGA